MRIIRSSRTISGSVTVVTGNVTLSDGDVVVSDPDNGIILHNQAGDPQRITVVEEEGVNTLQVKDA